MSGHDLASTDMGGWNLHVQHKYNFHSGILQKGDGNTIYLKYKPQVTKYVRKSEGFFRGKLKGCHGFILVCLFRLKLVNLDAFWAILVNLGIFFCLDLRRLSFLSTPSPHSVKMQPKCSQNSLFISYIHYIFRWSQL